MRDEEADVREVVTKEVDDPFGRLCRAAATVEQYVEEGAADVLDEVREAGDV